jgi:hypothetical protein
MARAIPLLTPAELRKQPGDALNVAHRMARAIPLLTPAELRKQPGDAQSAHNVKNHNFVAAKLFDTKWN